MGSTNTIVRAVVDTIKSTTNDFSQNKIVRAGIATGSGGLSEAARGGQRAKAGLESPAGAARDAANDQKRKAAELAAAAELRRTNEEGAAAAATSGKAARSRQMSLARGNQGRRSTILTGPLGLLNDAETTRKSILGA